MDYTPPKIPLKSEFVAPVAGLGKSSEGSGGSQPSSSGKKKRSIEYDTWDDHSLLQEESDEDDKYIADQWQERIKAAAEAEEQREQLIDEVLLRLGQDKVVQMRIKERSKSWELVGVFRCFSCSTRTF